ncbi:hypothetical protein ACJ2A9_04805 [Anaerobacillus sp. MEB173]
MQIDANKVIDKLLLKIMQLEKENVILSVQIDELIGLNNKMNKIEEANK